VDLGVEKLFSWDFSVHKAGVSRSEGGGCPRMISSDFYGLCGGGSPPSGEGEGGIAAGGGARCGTGGRGPGGRGSGGSETALGLGRDRGGGGRRGTEGGGGATFGAFFVRGLKPGGP